MVPLGGRLLVPPFVTSLGGRQGSLGEETPVKVVGLVAPTLGKGALGDGLPVGPFRQVFVGVPFPLAPPLVPLVEVSVE